MISDDLKYLDDYVSKLNGWNVRVLKQPELILDRDYEKISQKIQDDMEDLAGYYKFNILNISFNVSRNFAKLFSLLFSDLNLLNNRSETLSVVPD